MSELAYIEQLRLCPLRPSGPLPRVPPRLVELIRDHGVIEPVAVRQVGVGAYEILGNVETWMAAQQVRLEQVPIHVLSDVSDEEAEEIVNAASSGYAIDPIDEAEYLSDQLERIDPSGRRHRAVAKLAYLTGHRQPYISHALRLLKLPESIQRLLRAGSLSAGHGRALVGVQNRGAQLSLAKRAIAQGLSVRQVESLARGIKHGVGVAAESPTRKADTHKDPDIRRLETTIGAALGCGASLDAESGELTIRYYNLDILEGVLQKLGITDS